MQPDLACYALFAALSFLTVCVIINNQNSSGHVYPITTQQILDSPKLKVFADDNFKFDGNSRKLSKWIENTVGKRVIARYEQLLLFPQCFQKACFPGASKGVIVWEWVKSFPKTSPCFQLTAVQVFRKTL